MSESTSDECPLRRCVYKVWPGCPGSSPRLGHLQLSSGIRFDWQYKAGVPTIAGAYAWDADGFALVNDTATYSVAMPAFPREL